MNALAAVVLLSCTALAAAGGLSTSYGPPAPAPAPVYAAPAPAPVYAAPAPAVQLFAPAPAPVLRAGFASVPAGIHAIPVVPFPGFGRAVVHHFADKVNHVANHVARTVTLAGEAANNIVRSIVEDKRALLNALVPPAGAAASSGAPSTVYFTPESLAVSAPPAGLAPPVNEYAAPAPAPATQYGVPSF